MGLPSFALGLVFFIVAMDRPFAGTKGTSPAPIASALLKMDSWAAQAAATAGSSP